jgi:hypothetical protein
MSDSFTGSSRPERIVLLLIISILATDGPLRAEDDPLRFELENEVTVVDAHAPEVFQDENGDWFISSAEWPHRGVSIAPLTWR